MYLIYKHYFATKIVQILINSVSKVLDNL